MFINSANLNTLFGGFKAAERTVAGLWQAIGRIIDTFSATECTNYFAAAGCDATDRLPT